MSRSSSRSNISPPFKESNAELNALPRVFGLSWPTSLNRMPIIGWMTLFALFLGSVACDDETLPPKERQVFVEVPGNDPSIDPTTGGFNNPEAIGTRILVPAGDTEKTLGLNGEVEVGVILFDQNGDPVMGEQVSFEIIDPELAGAELSASRTVTDMNGYGRISFYAGETVRDYEVVAQHPDARSVVRFSLDVLDLPTGGLRVRFDYQGPVSLDQLEVYLIDEATYCDTVYYLAPPDEVTLSQNGLNVSDEFLTTALPAGQTYSVVVRARTQSNGVLAAGGCTGDIRITENEQRDITVSLLLLPLNPAGRYEVINHFDFTDAIPGQVGEVIEGLVRLFGDQNNEREIGGLIFDVIDRLAREAAGAIGGLVIDLIRNWVEDDLNDLINRYIDDDGPQWIRDFFTIGSDLISVVSNMEVISEMNFTKARSDGTYDGTQNWVGLAFYWRLNCVDDPDPDCGRYAFTMDELIEGAEGINLVFGQFDGRIHSYNQGIINLHNMDLQYGRLILFVLNQIILPRIADGATSIGDALLNLANCSGFAERLTGGRSYLRLGGINIVSRARIEDWCESALSFTGTAATFILDGLDIDTRMDLQGALIFLEEDDDLVVDRLDEGSWWGALRTSEEAAPPFEGDFHGTRALDEE
jgi:hypothetical protein